MSKLIGSRRVKTRKPHYCMYCGKEIPRGETDILYEYGLLDGVSFKRWTCHECEPFVDRFWAAYDRMDEGLLDWQVRELWKDFRREIDGEPFEPVIECDQNGRPLRATCGNCGHILAWREYSMRLPTFCHECGALVEGGGNDISDGE